MRWLVLLALLVFAAPARAEIRVIDVYTGAVQTLNAGPLRGWSDDGAALFVGDVTRLDLASGSSSPQPQLGGAISIGPGGRSVDSKDGVYRLRAPDGRVLARVRRRFSDDTPTIAWSSARVAVELHSRVNVFDVTTGKLLVRHQGSDASVSAQAFAPDGSALVVGEGSRVVRVDVPSGRTKVIYEGYFGEFATATWASNGRIAIARDRGIQVMGQPGIDVRLDDFSPALWSADGRLLSFLVRDPADPCGKRHGVAVAAPGVAPRTVVAPSAAVDVRSALWSPAGTRLAVDVIVPASEVRGARKPWPRRVARDYGMSSKRANAAMRRIVLRAARVLRRGAGREEVLSRVRSDYVRADERFFGAASDTVVREAVADELDRWLVAAGFEPIEAFDEITC